MLIQVANSFSAEPGGRIDVSGGQANLSPPVIAAEAGSIPLYESNIRKVGTEMRTLGGKGGNGAVGRVRIEVPLGSNLLRTAFNDSVYSALLFLDAAYSKGVSKVFPLGVGPGNMAISHEIVPEMAIMRFADQALPDGTDAILLWEGAEPSVDMHGVTGPLIGGVEDIRDLFSNEYVRFTVQIVSNGVSRETPTITAIEVPYTLGNPQSGQ